MPHFISSVSHSILSGLGLHGPWFIFFGLVAWAVAYVFLTRVVTPDSIGELMTLIVTVLPFFSLLFALAVALPSLLSTPRHIAQGIIFIFFALVAGRVTFFQCKDQEVRKELAKILTRPTAATTTIPEICWGLFGAMIVFASEFGLIFGGWQFFQGSWLSGVVWAGVGAVIVALSLVSTFGHIKNPFREGVLALQPDKKDRSGAQVEPPTWRTLWASARERVVH